MRRSMKIATAGVALFGLIALYILFQVRPLYHA